MLTFIFLLIESILFLTPLYWVDRVDICSTAITICRHIRLLPLILRYTSQFANKFALKFHSRRIWLVCGLAAAGRLFAKSIRCNDCYSARFVSLGEFRKKIFGRYISNRMETRTVKIKIIYLLPLCSPLLSVSATPLHGKAGLPLLLEIFQFYLFFAI